jgi:hypothetical protein
LDCENANDSFAFDADDVKYVDELQIWSNIANWKFSSNMNVPEYATNNITQCIGQVKHNMDEAIEEDYNRIAMDKVQPLVFLFIH